MRINDWMHSGYRESIPFSISPNSNQMFAPQSSSQHSVVCVTHFANLCSGKMREHAAAANSNSSKPHQAGIKSIYNIADTANIILMAYQIQSVLYVIVNQRTACSKHRGDSYSAVLLRARHRIALHSPISSWCSRFPIMVTHCMPICIYVLRWSMLSSLRYWIASQHPSMDGVALFPNEPHFEPIYLYIFVSE